MKTVKNRRLLHKFLAIAITVVLLLGMMGSFSMNVFAAEDNWADETNRDTAWKNGAISTPQQLAQFAHLVNTGTYEGDDNVWLTADIDLAGKEWTPIGNKDNDNTYSGLFNGNGFAVKNMIITNFTKEYREVGLYGLFGLLDEGTVQYLTVTGNITCREYSQWYFIGGIVGYSNFGKIIGCVSDVVISIEADPNIGGSDVGGIVGSNYGEVIGCTNNDNIYIKKGNSVHTGGIAGLSVGIIDRCENNGDITGSTTFIGGVTGYSFHEDNYYDTPQITNCINTGNIEEAGTSKYGYYGGIAGYVNNVTVENCYSTGSPTNMDGYWGNLAAEVGAETTLANCYYLGNGEYGIARHGNAWTSEEPSIDQGTECIDSEMKAESFVTALNGTGNAFVFNPGGYPVLAPLRVTVNINTAPDNATVVVKQDGKEISAEVSGTYLLSPGEYSVTVTLENYEPKTETFTVTLNQDTHTVNITLSILPADYSMVNAAKAKIPSDLTVYTDDSVAELKAAVAAVVEGLDITKQNEVNGYAKAIEKAIKGLVLKTTKSTTPNTGDNSTPWLYISISLLMLSIIITLIVKRMRKYHS